MKKTTIALLSFVLIIAVLLLCFFKFSPQAIAGDKTITIEIRHSDGTLRVIDLKTDEAYLGSAMEKEGLLAGEDTEYGLFVKVVDGEAVSENSQEWWGYTKSGEYVEYGVDSCPIADGDHYEFTFNIGW